MTSTLSERSRHAYKFGVKPLPLLFLLGALISFSAIGLSLGFARAALLHFDTEIIANASSEGAVLSRTIANFGAGPDANVLFAIDLRGSKTGGARWPVGGHDGFPAAVSLSAQTRGPLTRLGPAKISDDSFDCYAAEPRSHDYEIGNYAEAFKEIEALATEQCPRATHLLAVMYAKGQGVKQDPVRAYALLLIAFSEGVTPFGGSETGAFLGDDSEEFEIVQFGARLTNEQLLEAEQLAFTMVDRHAIAESGAIGPTGIADAIHELDARRARYKLNGKLAAIELPDINSPLQKGMQHCGRGHVLAQLTTGVNSEAIPHGLLFIERKMKDVACGLGGGNQALKQEIDIASAQGETFDWLKTGEAVRIIRFGVNVGFASQIELLDGHVAGPTDQKYWVDNCFLEMKDPEDQHLLQGVRAGQCH
jgi:hypothetical protein